MRPKLFKLPRSVQITSKVKYKVKLVDYYEDATQEGECDSELKEITMLRKLGSKKREEVLWHEILHAMVFENGWNIEDTLEETVIKSVDRALSKIMRLNNLRFS